MIWRSRKGFVLNRERAFVVLDHFGAIMEEHEKRRHFKVDGNPHFLVTYVDDGELRQRSGPVTWHGFGAKTVVLDSGLVEDASDETREMLCELVGIYVPAATRTSGDPRQRILERLAELGQPRPPPTRDGTLVRYSRLDSLEHLGRDVERTKQELMEREGELPERLLVMLLTIALEKPSEAALTAYVRACLLFMKKAAPEIDETWLPVAAPQLAAPVAKLVDDFDEIGATSAADAMETCAVLLGLRGTWAS